RDAGVDHGLRIFGNRHGAFENLVHELLHQILAALLRRRLLCEPPFFDNLIQKTGFEYLLDRLSRLTRLHCVRHWNLPSNLIPSSISPASHRRPPRRATILRACRCLAGFLASPRAWSAGPAVP